MSVRCVLCNKSLGTHTSRVTVTCRYVLQNVTFYSMTRFCRRCFMERPHETALAVERRDGRRCGQMYPKRRLSV